ncbi:hypothetical protein IP78_02395 [Brevundimonas sp. AAP58]|uniref:hypothetical protein n=1 Tax=Brevundimonas sp. AAP58 TaxID=1523422 RepID=UPI0006B88A1C|nr:hypothetical protein [Brevundimonas sp. AAP58]KPF83397.1 hypothetical protein IP78_02395 [Brevundimonas sp. AAP58]
MSTLRTLCIVAVAVLGASGCALLPFGREYAVVRAMPGQLEPIHAAAITRDLAVFWVSSNGCTDKDDLTPVVERARDGSTITLRRIDEDTCDQPMAEGIEIIWSFEELGLAPGERVRVNNPYQLPPSI